MINALLILTAFILVFLNAFFVAAEFAIVKLRHTQLEALESSYGVRGRILSKVHHHLDAYLSACQLGITLASLGLGWVGEPAFSYLLQPLFQSMGIHSAEIIEFLSFFVAFTFISFLHIVVGELMPKTLAIRQAEVIALWTAVPLYIFHWIMFPAIWFLNSCSNFLLKVISLNTIQKGESFYSTDEIKLILSSSYLHGELSKDETDMMEHTLDFADLQVTDIMRPFDDMVTLEIHQSLSQMIQIAMEKRYSRYPVIDGSKKNIIGIVHIKDLFFAEHTQLSSIQSLLRPILKFSAKLSALELLRKFREGMPHFAIVYKGEFPIGFVTLDNLLHNIVGRIKDEFHLTKDDWVMTADGGFVMSGNSPIYTVEQALQIDILTDEEVSTLSGLIMNKLGSMPTVGQRIEFENFIAVIELVKGPRILKVKIYRKKA